MNKLHKKVYLPERHAVSLLVLKRSVYACSCLCSYCTSFDCILRLMNVLLRPLIWILFLFLKLSLIVNSFVSSLVNQILICFINFNVNESWSVCSEMFFLKVNWEMICHKMMTSFLFPFCFKIQKYVLSVEALVTNTGSNWITSLWVASKFIQYIHKSEEPNGLFYEFTNSSVV
jgi:hypothetical protein